LSAPPPYDAAAARIRLLAKLPSLRVGDVWRLPRGVVTVTCFKSQEDYGIPWPMVGFTVGGQREDTGAPAFMFGELVTRGTGAEWSAPAEEQAA
jgi:hypothetical protein